nr:MAG TPA: hypothetical protein [Caudoviricetes sp.]
MVDVREIDGAIAEIENSELTMTRVKNLAALCGGYGGRARD